jgi:hypothetical protein
VNNDILKNLSYYFEERLDILELLKSFDILLSLN